MQATTPKSSSAIWRAIVDGREALSVGLLKHIGDGASTSISEDRWIPSTATMRPIFRPPASVATMVSDLIDEVNWTWKHDLVRDTFIAPDAEAILNIPLRQGGGEDFLAWAHERSVIYSVKSAYRALMNQKERLALEEGQIATPSMSEQQMWSQLWKLKVAPKVRVFWWRVLKGIIPNECTLHYRHIKDNSLCKLCLAMDEDLMHALVHCSHARSFWEEARILFDIRLPQLHPNTSACDILCEPSFTDKDRATIIIVMWAIWMSHNRRTHDQENIDPASSVRRIREDLALLDIPRQAFIPLPGHGWRPREESHIKINTDAAIQFDTALAGLGGVARSSSALLGAWCKPQLEITDPFIAEMLALREGVIFAKLRGFLHVQMETDCLEAVNLWNLCYVDWSIVAPIVAEIRELSASFSSFNISHVIRVANGPAHLCAKRACTLYVTERWLDSTPNFLVSSLLADCPANAFV